MLGVPPRESKWPDIWAEFNAGGAGFALHAVPPEIAQEIEIASPPQPRERTPIKLSFGVNDVSAERTRLESLGITTLTRPWQDPAESFDGIDPEGNLFQISAARP
jgi:hypothetical protein